MKLKIILFILLFNFVLAEQGSITSMVMEDKVEKTVKNYEEDPVKSKEIKKEKIKKIKKRKENIKKIDWDVYSIEEQMEGRD